MTHGTGYQTITVDARRPTLPTMLDYLEHTTDRFNLKITWTELKRAREVQARADELRTTFAQRVAHAREDTTDAARGYAHGDTSAADLIDQAAAAAVLSGEVGQETRRLVEAAAVAVESEGAPLLHDIGEDRWLKLLRPVVDERLQAAHTIADEVGLREPQPQRVGTRSTQHPWAPTSKDLDDMALRHPWERLGAALDDLDAAHCVADTLRMWGLLPVVEHRRLREDYRWRHLDRLDGDPGEPRPFFLANRHHAEPGLYSAAEMAEADRQPAPAA